MDASNSFTKSSGALHQPGVLLVEDHAETRGQLTELLRENGYAVTATEEGAEALRMLRKGGIDVVLLDLWLPGMDGWSFRAEQRAEKALSEIPVVVMTADDSPQARAIDAAVVLHKPFGAETLCRTIRNVLFAREVQVKSAAELVSEAVNLLVGGMGHEVGNALMGLMSTLERVREGVKEERSPDQILDTMLAHCERIANSLRTLRGLPCPSWSRECDIELGKVVRAAIARVKPDWARIEFEAEENTCIRGDPLVVLYVCTALLQNAIEAVPRSKRGGADGENRLPDVHVRTYHVASEIVLEVRDFGAPIPEDELRRIFALDNPGREQAWGAGLRLWFVRQVVDVLGGLIEISNVEDGGVRCRVRLPSTRASSSKTTLSFPP